MILVDTSVWVQHLRHGDTALATALDDQLVLMHPWIVGELALGQLHQRAEVLALLRSLPQAPVATPDETLLLIDHTALAGTGIGYVDVQLLASARLDADAKLWTYDKRLAAQAARLGCAHAVP